VPLLDVKDLKVTFLSKGKEFSAVNGISFHVNNGETLGILGESGSGKSVSALSVLRLLPASSAFVSGKILFTWSGDSVVNLVNLPEREIQNIRGNRISMIFQEPMTSLNPVISCGKQVMESILQHQKISIVEAKEKTMNWFREVQLQRPGSIFGSYPHQLSGGQRQRVMIAMAMACFPSLIIADEPTTALDVTVQKTILDLMKNLQEKYRMAILFITHDIGVISQIAGRIAVMQKGIIVEDGNVKSVLNQPQHPYTKGLMACRPPLDKRPLHLLTVNDYLTLKIPEADHLSFSEDGSIPESGRKRRLQEMYSHAPFLEIKNLSKWFSSGKSFFGKSRGLVKAVDDVSFVVYKGESVGLIGESGSGKTTLGRTILKLIDSNAGDVIYNGVSLVSLSRKETRKFRKKIQIIFQDPYSSLNPRITIGEAISEPIRVHKTRNDGVDVKNKVFDLLFKVGFDDSYYNSYPHELSGGQRQRVVIARALATSPEFIICDEPVSALDVSIQAMVLNLLNSLKKEFSLTFIFISHDLAVVKFMCDRMIVMNNGKIEETGESDYLYYNPASDYTRKLIGSVPVIK
jgi:peptide/nickel transport system ATP-binding protein